MDNETVVITKPRALPTRTTLLQKMRLQKARRPDGGANRGLFSLVTQALCNIYDLRDSYSRFYFDYSENIFYRDERYGRNVFNYYFDQDEQLLAAEKKTYVDWVTPWDPRRDTWHDPSPTLRAEVAALVRKYIRVKAELLANVEAKHKILFRDKRVLGLHKRGTDHWMHGQPIPIEHYFGEVDQRLPNFDALYLATDEEATLSQFQQRYGDKLINLDVMRSSDANPIHKFNFRDNYRKGVEVLTESLLLSKVNLLLKTRSNVSLFSLLYNEQLAYDWIDKHIAYH